MFKPPLLSTLLPRLLTGSSFLNLNLIYWPYPPSLGGSFVSKEMDKWCQSREHRKHHSSWQLNKFFDFPHWRLRGKWIHVAWHWKDFFSLSSFCVCGVMTVTFPKPSLCSFYVLGVLELETASEVHHVSLPTWNTVLLKPSSLYHCCCILWVSGWEDGHQDMMDGSWLATCS